jgi:hypothetical protein
MLMKTGKVLRELTLRVMLSMVSREKVFPHRSNPSSFLRRREKVSSVDSRLRMLGF